MSEVQAVGAARPFTLEPKSLWQLLLSEPQRVVGSGDCRWKPASVPSLQTTGSR